MNSKRRCPNCKKYNKTEEVTNINNRYYCNQECAVQYAIKNKPKGAEIKHKAKKKGLRDNDKSYRKKMAQQAFNAYIRIRDNDLPCISCQRYHNGQYHAGHYRSVGSSPELRFEEHNCHKQCSACNNYLSGNIGNYRINLVKKIGEDKVDWLEGNHDAKKYTCEELKEIERHYKQKLKELVQ